MESPSSYAWAWPWPMGVGGPSQRCQPCAMQVETGEERDGRPWAAAAGRTEREMPCRMPEGRVGRPHRTPHALPPCVRGLFLDPDPDRSGTDPSKSPFPLPLLFHHQQAAAAADSSSSSVLLGLDQIQNPRAVLSAVLAPPWLLCTGLDSELCCAVDQTDRRRFIPSPPLLLVLLW
jgi:hypothetical protein